MKSFKAVTVAALMAQTYLGSFRPVGPLTDGYEAQAVDENGNPVSRTSVRRFGRETTIREENYQTGEKRVEVYHMGPDGKLVMDYPV